MIMQKGAIFSLCRTWRYTLWRIWSPSKPACQFIGLNPSTATEEEDDTTVRRCIRYAADWGYGALIMTNIFGYRSTDPKGLMDIEDPVGPENDFHLAETSRAAGIVIAAWGNHDSLYNRCQKIHEMIEKPLHCVAVTKTGQPGHPLYLKKNLKPPLLRQSQNTV